MLINGFLVILIPISIFEGDWETANGDRHLSPSPLRELPRVEIDSPR